MDPALKQDLIDYLADYVTDHKQRLMDRILAQRTRYIAVVLEDIYQPHNASAVVRSCECFGVQDAHVIEGRNSFRVSRGVTVGSAKWLSIHRYRATRPCLAALKERGYRLAAATLRPDSMPIQALGLEQKVALCFGTEEEGLSPEAHALADCFVRIPMYGFTQSFNISVSVALCLFELTERLRASAIEWGLTEAEKLDIKYEWMRTIPAAGDLLVERYLAERGLIGQVGQSPEDSPAAD